MEKIAGIYKIEQISNKKVYIGSSNNIKRRCHRHMTDLRCNRHDNKYLQNAFNKYGKNDFKIEMLEKCPNDMLQEREQYYIDKFESYNECNGFNLLKNAYSSKGKIVSQETKEKLKKFSNSEKEIYSRRKRMIEKWKDPSYRDFQLNERKERSKNEEYINKRNNSFSSEEYKNKRSDIAKKMWKNENSRNKLLKERRSRCDDEDYKKKLSESAKKKWQNEEYRKKQSEKFSIGQKKRYSDPEYRKKMSEMAKMRWANKKLCNV